MKIGDLVAVNIESGHSDIGLILSVQTWGSEGLSKQGEKYYEVMCHRNKTICIASEDMIELLSKQHTNKETIQCQK